MFEFFAQLLNTDDFPARWHCGNWTSQLGWLHIGSDIAIWAAYTAIPICIAYFAYRKGDIAFPTIAWLFVGFIFACGTTHLIEAGIFWWPAYRFSGLAKFSTATISWFTVLALVRIAPQAMELPGLSTLNNQLRAEIARREEVEQLLRKSEESLKIQVADRTEELEKTNAHLQSEIEVSRAAQLALEQQQSILALFVRHAPAAIAMFDNEMRYVVASDRWTSDYGLEGVDPTGRSHYELFPDISNEWKEIHRRCLEGSVERRERDAFVRDAGHTEYIRWEIHPWHSAPNTIGGIIMFTEVITDRVEAEESLEARQEELTRSNRDLEEFAYIASHDLQEPLRKIQTFGKRILDNLRNDLPEREADYLDRMGQAANRMQAMIDGLLEFSRVTTKVRPFEPVSLGQVAEDAVSNLESRIESSNGHVSLGDLPTVEGDPLQLAQLFQNLIANALKFTDPDRSPVVSITAEPAGAGKVRIVVTDNGIGFDPDHADRIFRPFDRLHPRSDYEGAGIGLSICRKVVDRHGGKIWATSNPREGSAFYIELPLRAV